MTNVIAVLLNERIDGIKNLTERLFMDKLDELTLPKEEFYPKFKLLLSDRANWLFDKREDSGDEFKNFEDDEINEDSVEFEK